MSRDPNSHKRRPWTTAGSKYSGGFLRPPGHDDDLGSDDPAHDTDPPQLLRIQEELRVAQERKDPAFARSECANEFCRVYEPMLRDIVRQFRIPGISPGDCLNEIWTVVLKELPGLQYNPARGRFRSWLRTLTYRTLLNLARQARRHPLTSLSLEDQMLLQSRQAELGAALDRSVYLDQVHAVVEALPRELPGPVVQVFRLRTLENKTVAEVAECLHLTEREVWDFKRRGMIAFFHCYTRMFGNPAR